MGGVLRTGGVQTPLIVPMILDETIVALTTHPVGEEFIIDSHRYVTLLDLSGYSQVRMVVNRQANTAAATAKLTAKYRAAGFSSTVGNYSDIGTSAVEVSLDTGGGSTILDSGWIALVAAAKADVAVTITQVGGDGVASPSLGGIYLQFK